MTKKSGKRARKGQRTETPKGFRGTETGCKTARCVGHPTNLVGRGQVREKKKKSPPLHEKKMRRGRRGKGPEASLGAEGKPNWSNLGGQGKKMALGSRRCDSSMREIVPREGLTGEKLRGLSGIEGKKGAEKSFVRKEKKKKTKRVP